VFYIPYEEKVIFHFPVLLKKCICSHLWHILGYPYDEPTNHSAWFSRQTGCGEAVVNLMYQPTFPLVLLCSSFWSFFCVPFPVLFCVARKLLAEWYTLYVVLSIIVNDDEDYTLFCRQLDFWGLSLGFWPNSKQLLWYIWLLVDILIPNGSSDREDSFKRVFAGRVSSVSRPFSKIA